MALMRRRPGFTAASTIRALMSLARRAVADDDLCPFGVGGQRRGIQALRNRHLLFDDHPDRLGAPGGCR